MLKARSTFDFTWAKNKTNKIKNSIDVSWRCTWYIRFQNSYLKGTYTYSILVCTSNYFLPTIMVNVLLFKSVCDFLLNRKSGEIVMNKILIILLCFVDQVSSMYLESSISPQPRSRLG